MSHAVDLREMVVLEDGVGNARVIDRKPVSLRDSYGVENSRSSKASDQVMTNLTRSTAQ